MTAVRSTLAGFICLTVVALVSAPGAHAQAVSPEPSRADFDVSGQFTEAYQRARDRTAAFALLKDDPVSLEAFALLVRAGRWDDALDVMERVGRERPDLLASASNLLLELGGGEFPEDPRSQTRTARLRALRNQFALLPKAVAQLPSPFGHHQPTLGERADDPFFEAREDLYRASESLRQRTKWSPRSIRAALAPSHRRLREIADRGRGTHRAAALALLADSEFEAGQLREALSDFTALARRYQNSDTAWAAAMRVAQLAQSLDGPDTAARSFARIAEENAAKPVVPVLARFYEARAYEATSRWSDALRAYRASLNDWPTEDEMWYGLDWRVLYFAIPARDSFWPYHIDRKNVARRIDALARAVADPMAGQIERVTWLLDHRRPSEARDVLRRLAETPAGRMSSAAVQTLLHRSQVDIAVAVISRSGRVPAGSRRALERLCSEPFDPWTAIGCAIHASVLAVDGHAEAAQVRLQQTLRTWVQSQHGLIDTSLSDDEIVRDAMAIRDLLFEPYGVEDSEPHSPPPFIFIPATISVTDRGTWMRDVENRSPRGRSNVIRLSFTEARTLWETLERLSICKWEREWQRLDGLWIPMLGFTQQFCAAAGSWYTGPQVGPIHFMNAERTLAHVVVIIGKHADGGHVAIVEKAHGEWKLTGYAGSWYY